MAEPKRRKLRSSGGGSPNTAKLFDFSRINSLLYRDGKIRIDRRSKPTDENLYHFFESPADHVKLPAKNVQVTEVENSVPRRNASRADPLGDEVYLPFHRRMKKDEKSMSVADKNRILNDVDNLKSQLQNLRQNDWLKHLPATTALHGCSSMEEFLVQRKLTINEIERLMQKFADWESRNAQLAAQMKHFEQYGEGDSSDDDEDLSVLSKPIEKIVKRRAASRLKKHGPKFRINLRNGYEILADPFRVPKVVVRRSGKK